jgi:hypothetical protein
MGGLLRRISIHLEQAAWHALMLMVMNLLCNKFRKLSITWRVTVVEWLGSDHRGCILDTVITETNPTLKCQ